MNSDGSPDPTNQPFRAGDNTGDPCPYDCIELNQKQIHAHQGAGESLKWSNKNFSSRMMAYNYNIYMRNSTSSSSVDPGFLNDNNEINKQDPKEDYSKWRDEWAGTGVDDWKEWRSTTLVAYLMDPSDAIDDDNYACRIGGAAERGDDGNARSSDKSTYCHRMIGNDGSLVTDFHWGGLGHSSIDYNKAKDAWWGDPVPSGETAVRHFNDCITSEGQRWSEDVFGTAIVVSVRRFFDWF